MKTLAALLLSFLLVSFGQPQYGSLLPALAAAFGYALAFFAARRRYWVLAFWFFAVQLVQLSWMSTTTYHGVYILFAYVGIALALGAIFGLLSFFNTSYLGCLAAASFWTLFEWGRQFFLCGFAWNPVGLALAGNPVTTQIASLASVLGLSFLVILIGFLAQEKRRASLGALLFTYALGGLLFWGHRPHGKEDTLAVLLVQTGLRPEEKVPFSDQLDAFVSPAEQWRRIFEHIENSERADLIVLPESAVPYGATYPIYPDYFVRALTHKYWGEEVLIQEETVGNQFFAQLLADHYGSDVVVGFEDSPHNVALHFRPLGEFPQRYEKQILVPLGEYLPFSFLNGIVAKYGIHDFFVHGKGSKVLDGIRPLSVSICYEECFPHVMRQARRLGAELFLNVTNDGYFPDSTLPEQHFQHGRLRAVENGVPLLRACNSGVTVAVDSRGFIIDRIKEEWVSDTLFTHLDLHTYKTVYSSYGIAPLLIICFISILSFLFWNFLLARKNKAR